MDRQHQQRPNDSNLELAIAHMPPRPHLRWRLLLLPITDKDLGWSTRSVELKHSDLKFQIFKTHMWPASSFLLSHDNTDIAIDVVQLLQDLTDEDVLDDNDDSARVLVDALAENELLVHNLHRLNNSDPNENAAVYGNLATMENLIEVKPVVAELVCKKTRLLKGLLGKIKLREFDSNKQYASEILAILLQSSIVNKELFVKAGGVELMIIIMKHKKLAYGFAIRALDFAMTKYPPACERFVDVLGLKIAFAAFMGSSCCDLGINFGFFVKRIGADKSSQCFLQFVAVFNHHK